MKDSEISFYPVGCSGIICYLGNTISNETNDLVHIFTRLLQDKMLHKFTGIVPSYHSVTIYYDSIKYTYNELVKDLKINFQKLKETVQNEIRNVYEIPVCYGASFGSDIYKVSLHNEITVDEVIKLHQGNLYRIYMIGFLPGFPYLGGMNGKLATPRLSKPKIVQKGSVGIAGEQTGIYPFESPGGWNIIGRTPISIFPNHTLERFKPGDYLRFKSINENEFYHIENDGNYVLKKEVLIFD